MRCALISLFCAALFLSIGGPSRAQNSSTDSKAFEARGDEYSAQGNFADAKTAYEQRAAALRNVLSTHSDASQAQVALVIALTKLGDAEMHLNDLDGAAKTYDEQLQMSRKIAEECRGCEAGNSLLVVALDQVGDVEAKLGKTADALKSYQDGLDVTRRTLAMNPTSNDDKNQVSNSLDHIGDLLIDAKRFKEARPYLEESLKARRLLAAAQPDDGGIQRDLVVTLMKMSQATNDPAYPREALAVVIAMKKKGLLAPADAWMIDDLQKLVGQ